MPAATCSVRPRSEPLAGRDNLIERTFDHAGPPEARLASLDMTLPLQHRPFRREPLRSHPYGTMTAAKTPPYMSGIAKQSPLAFPPSNPRRPATLSLSLYPGAEAWIRVAAEGRAFWLPGHTSLVDLTLRLHGW